MTPDTENIPTPGKIAEALHWNVEQCTKFAMDLLEEANCHGAAILIDMYREQGYPSLTDVNTLIKKLQKGT